MRLFFLVKGVTGFFVHDYRSAPANGGFPRGLGKRRTSVLQEKERRPNKLADMYENTEVLLDATEHHVRRHLKKEIALGHLELVKEFKAPNLEEARKLLQKPVAPFAKVEK